MRERQRMGGGERERERERERVYLSKINNNNHEQSIYRGGLPERAEAHHSWPPIVIYNMLAYITNTGIDLAGKCAECMCKYM